MARYAQSTEVSSSKSRDEIERTLTRYGAAEFMYGWKAGSAVVGFRMKDRLIRFILPMPDPKSREFTHTAAGRLRVDNQQREAYEQATRQRWRALALVIKAKLEACEAGISEFESEFMANIVLPDGRTVGDHTIPLIDDAYRTGKTPLLLPSYK